MRYGKSNRMFLAVCIVLSLIISLAGLSACGSKDSGKPAGKEDTLKQFLKLVYETNPDSRMDLVTEKDIDAYYTDFKDIVSEECLEKMQKNRIPYKYDKKYLDTPLKVTDISLTDPDDSGTYQYLVTASYEEQKYEFKGYIGTDDDGRVNYFVERG